RARMRPRARTRRARFRFQIDGVRQDDVTVFAHSRESGNPGSRTKALPLGAGSLPGLDAGTSGINCSSKIVPLGSTGLKISALGLGCMSMSGSYGEADDESIATIHRAVD